MVVLNESKGKPSEPSKQNILTKPQNVPNIVFMVKKSQNLSGHLKMVGNGETITFFSGRGAFLFVPSCKLAISLPRNYVKPHCKGEPYRFSCFEPDTDPVTFI